MKNKKTIEINGVEFFDPSDTSMKLPYESQSPLFVMQVLNIRYPFREVIDSKSMGYSVCPNCGRQYDGYRDRCGYKQFFWCVLELSGRKVEVDRQFLNREDARVYARQIESKAVQKECECNGHCRWNLADEFDEQVTFCSAMDSIANVVKRSCEGKQESLLQYRRLMPDGAALIYETEYLRERIKILELQVNQLYHKINENQE